MLPVLVVMLAMLRVQIGVVWIVVVVVVQEGRTRRADGHAAQDGSGGRVGGRLLPPWEASA
jgi:hypothetical protein